MNKLFYLIVFNLVFIFFGCNTNSTEKAKTQSSTIATSEVIDIEKTEPILALEKVWFDKVKGVLIYNSENYNEDILIYLDKNKKENITFNFEKDLMVFKGKEFSFAAEYSGANSDIYEKFGIQPYIFEIGGPTIFHMHIVAQTADFYIVDFGEFDAYIEKSDELYEFYTPEKYLMNTSIGTIVSENPVRKYPEINSEIMQLDTEIFWTFDILEIKGDWIKVQSFNMCESIEEEQFKDFTGWIKFKNEDNLLISLLFSC
ncbi:MAG: hypothetical protein AB8G11_06530 [Saprospiraceae bacterium]